MHNIAEAIISHLISRPSIGSCRWDANGIIVNWRSGRLRIRMNGRRTTSDNPASTWEHNTGGVGSARGGADRSQWRESWAPTRGVVHTRGEMRGGPASIGARRSHAADAALIRGRHRLQRRNKNTSTRWRGWREQVSRVHPQEDGTNSLEKHLLLLVSSSGFWRKWAV